MKIDNIKISNIMSFKFYEDMSNCPEIKFNEDLNIIIGANGSGKSTLLEVINFIFKKVLFMQVLFERQLYDNSDLTVEQRKNAIKLQNEKKHKDFRLEPNWDFQDKIQEIQISIILDNVDEANIKHLNDHNLQLNSMAQRFTHLSLPKLEVQQSIAIKINVDNKTNTFSVQSSAPETCLRYLTDYNLFKYLITIFNLENPGQNIKQLHDPLVLISSYRNYNNFISDISIGTIDTNKAIYDINTKEYSRSINSNESGEPYIFNLVRLLLAEQHYEISGYDISNKECEKRINKLPSLVAINSRLKPLNLELSIKLIERRTWNYSFRFKDTKRNILIHNINSLSAGQKAIIHLIFEAFGRMQLKGGLVIIDEPEIHLHYQLQNEYLSIIRSINLEQKCQYILVTHSESLITSENINKVKRFFLEHGKYTTVKSPNLTEDQKTLIKILDNTRSIYAFFSKKVILVEGDTDRYFITSVLRLLYPEIYKDIAVLDIGGKENYDKWSTFFNAFGLDVYFICDFDNIFTFAIVSDKQSELKEMLKQQNLDNLSEKDLEKLQNSYNSLISDQDFLTRPKRESWKNMLDTFINIIRVTKESITSHVRSTSKDLDSKIEELYVKRVYILKGGVLEDYTKTKHGDLAQMINFCENDLQKWIENGNTYGTEVKDIINRIVKEE